MKTNERLIVEIPPLASGPELVTRIGDKNKTMSAPQLKHVQAGSPSTQHSAELDTTHSFIRCNVHHANDIAEPLSKVRRKNRRSTHINKLLSGMPGAVV